MNRSVRDVGGAILAVSQFTLLADTRKGKRPSFVRAAPPEEATRLFDHFCKRLRATGVHLVETGRFGAMMDVSLVNDGPVTIPWSPPPVAASQHRPRAPLVSSSPGFQRLVSISAFAWAGPCSTC